MGMELTEKITTALANSSSTNYVDENALHSLGKKHDVTTALEHLLERRTIGSCSITKGGRTFSVYWLACQFSKPKDYSDLFTVEKRLEHAAAKPGRPFAKSTTERHCNICNTTQPSQAFNGKRNQCKKCMEIRAKERYVLKAADKELKPRWCMACKKNHPAADFGNTRSRRCVASTILYKQNERAIILKKIANGKPEKERRKPRIRQRPNRT